SSTAASIRSARPSRGRWANQLRACPAAPWRAFIRTPTAPGNFSCQAMPTGANCCALEPRPCRKTISRRRAAGLMGGSSIQTSSSRMDPAFRPSEEQSPDPPAQGGDDGRGGDRDDPRPDDVARQAPANLLVSGRADRSEEHTSELQSRENLVCRLLLEKKKNTNEQNPP